MSISTEFCIRKFFMDSHQKAYIAVDTLLIYIMTYAKCDTFIRARDRVISYLTVNLSTPLPIRIKMFTLNTNTRFLELAGLPMLGLRFYKKAWLPV